ncbi:hypothetical protein N658DRAFT_42576 [Parathielavia hyrcaniae]|uniref:Uncharacterized protein n=1 Tax=Parathielavia hyrcaniae TaxID=113614 RepID=A0AAN6Q1N6_9PEZI|nr:hypothetical protein N658DRAFT_42576 [Parathielavia hyrcaniae]
MHPGRGMRSQQPFAPVAWPLLHRTITGSVIRTLIGRLVLRMRPRMDVYHVPSPQLATMRSVTPKFQRQPTMSALRKLDQIRTLNRTCGAPRHSIGRFDDSTEAVNCTSWVKAAVLYRDGEVHWLIEIPSNCTAVAGRSDGRNGTGGGCVVTPMKRNGFLRFRHAIRPNQMVEKPAPRRRPKMRGDIRCLDRMPTSPSARRRCNSRKRPVAACGRFAGSSQPRCRGRKPSEDPLTLPDKLNAMLPDLTFCLRCSRSIVSMSAYPRISTSPRPQHPPRVLGLSPLVERPSIQAASTNRNRMSWRALFHTGCIVSRALHTKSPMLRPYRSRPFGISLLHASFLSQGTRVEAIRSTQRPHGELNPVRRHLGGSEALDRPIQSG